MQGLKGRDCCSLMRTGECQDCWEEAADRYCAYDDHCFGLVDKKVILYSFPHLSTWTFTFMLMLVRNSMYVIYVFPTFRTKGQISV